jgi:creatinine amidohydrolase/Fe(II)-dependent formamide hydrolase-like protein
MQCKKTMDDILLFKEIISFFTRLVQSGISQSNHCLLIINGHGSSHVTLKKIKDAHQTRLGMIITFTYFQVTTNCVIFHYAFHPLLHGNIKIHSNGLGLCPNGHC